jgi:beta-galactosidase
MVEYWHWHSIHNSAETYWKGLLSHDFQPNPTYNEAKTIGRDFERLSSRLINLKKDNQVAILFSNEALTAFNAFGFAGGGREGYNDVLRMMYDAFYRNNIGVDFVDPSSNNIEKYKLLIVPVLYAASDSLLHRLNNFVKNGGHIVYTFKSGFSNQNVKVHTAPQPAIISEACGISYSQFTVPKNVSLKDDPYHVGNENKITTWMELITPTTAKVLAYYDHPVWGKYAAITQNNYGKGTATYIGCLTSRPLMEAILTTEVKNAGLWGKEQDLHFPVIEKHGKNEQGKTIRYLFNYSAQPATIHYNFESGRELLSGNQIAKDSELTLGPWDAKIIEEK